MRQFSAAVEHYHQVLGELEANEQFDREGMTRLAVCLGHVCVAYRHCLDELEGREDEATYLKMAYLTIKKCAVVKNFEELARRYGLPTPREMDGHHTPRSSAPASRDEGWTRANQSERDQSGRTRGLRVDESPMLEEQMPFWKGQSPQVADQTWKTEMQTQTDRRRVPGGEISLGLESLSSYQQGGAWDAPPGTGAAPASSTSSADQFNGLLNTAGNRNETDASDFRPQVVVEVWIKDGCPDCARYLQGLKSMLSTASDHYNPNYRLAWSVLNERLHRQDPSLLRIPKFPALVVKMGRDDDLHMVGQPIMGSQSMDQIKSQLSQTINTAVGTGR